MSERRLHLIDGNSLAYRAFFALPDTFIDSKGMPNNALFGLASMFVQVLAMHDKPPTVVVWDAGLSGREQIYEPYKAQRDAKPDALREQWPQMAPLAESFGFSNIRVSGWEADDVIATLAERATMQGIGVVVVTGDRDALQLVSDNVTVMTTSRGITETKEYTPATVVERYGIAPSLVPDFIGLKGDTSDNIPGVPGIGEKTATQLLQEFGSLEGVLENIDKISGAKRKENLTEHADIARLSKKLATAHRDIEFDFDLDGAFRRTFEPDSCRETLREMELREPLRRLEKLIGGAQPDAVRRTKSAVAVKEESTPLPTDEGRGIELAVKQIDLSSLIARASEVKSLLTGTSLEQQASPATDLLDDAARHNMPVRNWFAAAGDRETVFVGETDSFEALLTAWGELPIVTHDFKGLTTALPPRSEADAGSNLVHDTRIAAFLIDSARRDISLGALSRDFRPGTPVVANEQLEPGLALLAADAWRVARVAERQRALIEELGLDELFSDVELPLVGILNAIERTGVAIDVARLGEIAIKFAGEIEQLEAQIYDEAGEKFTIGSPKQLGDILFERLGLSRKRRGKTGYSTDARVLAAIRAEHPIVEHVERWRELTKLKSTYLDALPNMLDPDDRRLHTTFNQMGAATGRLSSTNPNLQNIPVRTITGQSIRECFIAAEECVITSADYSQVELRVLAHIAKDKVMQDIFRRGEDVHRATAAEVFGVPLEEVDSQLRDRAKAVNFGIIYGLSAFGLSDRLKIPRDEAAGFIERYLGRFTGVQDFIKATIEQAKDEGFATTLMGRRRAIPELRSSQHVTRQLGERLAVNTVIQGTAADIIKVAMIRAFRALDDNKLDTRLVLQIHDELLFEGPEREAGQVAQIVKHEMESAYELDPPLVAEIGCGSNWLKAK